MALLKTQPLRTQPMTYGPDGPQQKPGLRHLVEQLVPNLEGVVGRGASPGDYKVTQRGAGANMSVDVAAGSAFVRGDTTARQGVYHQVNDGAVNVAIAANASGNPRLDRVYLQIADSSISGSSDTPALGVLQGSATGGAQAQDPGAANYMAGATSALGDNRILLAVVEVPGSSPSSITNAMIVDRRLFVLGNGASHQGQSGDLTLTANDLWVEQAATRLNIECAGGPVVVRFRARVSNFSGSIGAVMRGQPRVDGAVPTGWSASDSPFQYVLGVNSGAFIDWEWTFPSVAAGRHRFAWYLRADSSGNAIVVSANGTVPMLVEAFDLTRPAVLQ